MKFKWPESFEEKYDHFLLPKHLHNTLVLQDSHIPYHHIPAIDEAVNYGIVKKVDSILLNGDILDDYQHSKYQPDPGMRHFKDEIEAFKQFMLELKRAFPKAEIFYKLGNHEERYEKHMIQHAPEFLNIPYFNFENVLGCEDLGIIVVRDQKIVYIGKLAVFHGHEVGLKSINVNPARSLFLKVHTNAACGHLHRSSTHTEPSLDEDITCHSFGHLGDSHPKYARINKWNYGCGRVESDEEGHFEVINVNLTQNKLFRI